MNKTELRNGIEQMNTTYLHYEIEPTDKRNLNGREAFVKKRKVLDIIDQLDEPENVKTNFNEQSFRDWIKVNLMSAKLIMPSMSTVEFADKDLEDELVNAVNEAMDKPEKVVIPQFVGDAFDYNKNPYWEVDEAKDIPHILKCAFGNEAKPSDFLDWVRENPEDYVMAVRNGYEVKKEQLYYAKSKVATLPNWDNDGEDFFATLDDSSDDTVFLLDRYDNEGLIKTSSEWNRLGIDETIAIFEPVEEAP